MLSKEELIDFELGLKELWEEGKIRCPLHLSGGNEDQLIEIFSHITKGDYVLSTHRNHYHALLHGVDQDYLRAEILRDPGGLCKSRSGSMCTCDNERRFYSTAIVGGSCALACGIGYSLKMKNSPLKVWAFIGDGAVDGGHFSSAYRYCVSNELPVTFVIEDNDRSTCTSVKERWGNNELEVLDGQKNIIYYRYEPTYPHVGSGTYVQF